MNIYTQLKYNYMCKIYKEKHINVQAVQDF